MHKSPPHTWEVGTPGGGFNVKAGMWEDPAPSPPSRRRKPKQWYGENDQFKHVDESPAPAKSTKSAILGTFWTKQPKILHTAERKILTIYPPPQNAPPLESGHQAEI